jgi:hypothetical protein
MKFLKVSLVIALAGLLAHTTWAGFEITPAVQKELDKQVGQVKTWAADPVIVKAVLAQNEKGPVPGMDNPKWKTLRRSDAFVKEFQSNPAGQYLKRKIAESSGTYSEAFLSGAQGEKVAFFEKTTSYLHKGMPKFDVPFTSGKSWQGQPEFDESSQTHQIQIAVPVLNESKPVGVLVVGVSLTKLEKLTKK